MTIDWSEAPEWANWYAESRDGAKWWYSNKPKANTKYGEFVPQKLGHKCDLVDENYEKWDNSWWSTTLTKRPK